MEAQGSVPFCNMCNKPSKELCARCHSARYCSRECQQADWPIHKLLCRQYVELPDRPSKEHFRGIFFPDNETKPKFVWLHCPWRNLDEEPYQCPDMKPFKGKGNSLTSGRTKIQTNHILGRKLKDTIELSYRDAFLIDGSPFNRAIAAVSGAESAASWRGPIVAFGEEGLGIDPDKCRDMDMADFRHVVDFFQSYQTTAASSNEPTKSRGQKVLGVRINCHGDETVFKLPKFEAVEVPIEHPIFAIGESSEIANRIGLPILTHPYPPNKEWLDDTKWEKYGTRIGPFSNQAATFLHLNCDKKSSMWGWAPPHWQNSVGSILVVRQDKKKLLPLHMEAISRYCQFECQPLFEHSMGGYAPEKPMNKEVVLSTISRAMFIIFWYKFMKEKGEYPDSPYEV